MRPERRGLAALTALLVLAMGLPLAGPVLVGRFIDSALAGDPTATLVGLAAFFLAATLAGDGLQLLVSWLSVRLAWRVGNRLRTDLCRHALSLDLTWHGEHSPGQLIERIDGDVDALTRFSSTAVLQLAGNALMVLGTVVVASFIDWRAGLLVFGASAVASVVLILFRQAAVPYWDEEREVQSQLYGDLEERLGGLEDLRANGAGGWALHRLHHHSAGWWRTARRAAIWGDGSIAGASLAFAAGSVLTLTLGVWLHSQGQLSIGSVVALFQFSQTVSDPLWQVSEQLADMQKAAAGTRRAARLLSEHSSLADTKVDADVDGAAAPLDDGPLSVDLAGVELAYGDDPAVLSGIDLHLAPGTKLGVIGRTGSGKTSLGRLVLRLWDPTAGAVRLGGVDLRHVPAENLRRRTAVVTQEVELFRANLRDNVTLFGAVEATDAQVSAALDEGGLGHWHRSLAAGLDTELHGGGDLSAGEAQLLAFARVLLVDPGLVVLDEASSRLDPLTESVLARATTRLVAGRTAIVIAHRLATLDEVDQIVVIDGGRIIEHGDRATLAADPTSRYSRLRSAGGAALVAGVPS